MVQRVTYRRQCSYNTKSNKIRKVRTPGGKLVAQHTEKKVSIIQCAQPGCEQRLGGVSNQRTTKQRNLAHRAKTVSRPYGGALCGECVRTRIVRAFLTEEVKIVKKVMSAKSSRK